MIHRWRLFQDIHVASPLHGQCRPPWPYLDGMAADIANVCAVDKKAEEDACREFASCIRVEGAGHAVSTHGLMHTFQSAKAMRCATSEFQEENCTALGDAQRAGAEAVKDTFPESGCSVDCIEAQLKAYHEAPPPKGAWMKSEQPIKAVHTCKPDKKKVAAAEEKVRERKSKFDDIEAARANVVTAD